MRSNREFRKLLKAPTSTFYLFDLHVHSPGSADTRIGARFEALSTEEKALLPKLSQMPKDLAAYERDAMRQCPVDKFYDLLVNRRDEIADGQELSDGYDWSFVAITDHNVCEYASELSQHAWKLKDKNRLLILPGIELDVNFKVDGIDNRCGIHLLCIFAPLTNASDIRLAITSASNTTWTIGNSLEVESLPKLVDGLRKHSKYPAMCIAAHVSSSKGVQNEIRKSLLSNLEAAIARTKGEMAHGDNPDMGDLTKRLNNLEKRSNDAEAIHSQVLQHIGSCGFDALQVGNKQDEKHYRRLHRFKAEKGRAVPITCSDAHTVKNVFKNEDALSFLKLSSIPSSLNEHKIFNEIRERGLRYGDTRFSYHFPGRVSNWIAGLEINQDASNASAFWPFTSEETDGQTAKDKSLVIPLSCNLNCFIGGRGSGKSAALEAIAFVTNPDDFTEQGKKTDHPQWYERATATLSGCQIRVCWKSLGQGSFSMLEKKTLFQSRYFDPNHQHGKVEMTDLDGKEILSHSVPPPAVTLFRIHDIEEAAQPEKLRDLFDRIKGGEVTTLNSEIRSLCSQLKELREKMHTLAGWIFALTDEKKPLREFVKRKQQFSEVDKPEVKQKYADVDSASAAEGIANEAVEDWQEIIKSLNAEDLRKKANEYFVELRSKLIDTESQTRPNCEKLFALVDEIGERNRSGKILGAIKTVSDEFKLYGDEANGVLGEIVELHKKFREELTRQGLPQGSKDREAKKRAYEESVAALEDYKRFCQQWNEMSYVRKMVYGQLEDRCKLRTKLRKETAEALTAQLSYDLDQSVLVIEADARPVADKLEFKDWLMKNLAPTIGMRYRDSRVVAIIDKGIMPAQLRDCLLSNPDAIQNLLVNEKDRAEDGKISQDDHEKFISDTVGRFRLPPEIQKEKVTEDFWNDLPEEVKNGLWTFNIKGRGVNWSPLNAALSLDEVVFDDLPEIRLNDRPLDPQSKPRPLSDLSPGQRCSAILPILLLTGDSPLLIDQPEDNLDNRLIRQVIVNILASIKLRRQVIVATHNPNIPVLGDAEQTIILRAVREKACELEAMGNLDSPKVVSYITDIMEGGREAFQYRQTIYQSHWDATIAAVTSQGIVDMNCGIVN